MIGRPLAHALALSAAVPLDRPAGPEGLTRKLGEASGILETVEYGRHYLDLTRQFLDSWRHP